MLPGQRRRSKLALLGLLVLLIVGFSYNSVRTYIRAILLLKEVSAATQNTDSWLKKCFLYPVSTEEREVSTKSGALRARLYRPLGAKMSPGIVLAIGVHHLGIDEPRAISLARAFAAAGITVLSVEFPEFVDYRFEPATIESISVSAQYLAKQTGRAASGVVGISIAGGLALLAAADPASQRPIGFVVALGAHCDLNRVVRYFAGESVRDPSGHVYPVRPHPYGARVMLFGYLDKLFSPEDLPVAREALRLYLHDGHREARLHTKLLSESGREKMLRILDEGNVKEVGADLLSAAKVNESILSRVSPCGQLGHLRVPVYLIHGADDPVVPSTETLWLAHEVPQAQLKWALVSPVLRHAEIGPKFALSEYWKLVSFFAAVLFQTQRLPYVFESE